MMFQGLKTLWEAYSEDKGIVGALAIAVIVLMYSHIHIWLANRQVISKMADHIKDLIAERNRLHDALFGQKGRKRQSSQQGKP